MLQQLCQTVPEIYLLFYKDSSRAFISPLLCHDHASVDVDDLSGDVGSSWVHGEETGQACDLLGLAIASWSAQRGAEGANRR